MNGHSKMNSNCLQGKGNVTYSGFETIGNRYYIVISVARRLDRHVYDTVLLKTANTRGQSKDVHLTWSFSARHFKWHSSTRSVNCRSKRPSTVIKSPTAKNNRKKSDGISDVFYKPPYKWNARENHQLRAKSTEKRFKRPIFRSFNCQYISPNF